jgi:hypothetical protein
MDHNGTATRERSSSLESPGSPNIRALLQGCRREPGATQDNLRDLLSFVASELPDDYVDLLTFANGATGQRGGRHLIIFSSETAITINRVAMTKDNVPGNLIFASNGGGTSYLLELGQSQWSRVYRCEDVDMSHEQSVLIASSIEDFIRRFGTRIA